MLYDPLVQLHEQLQHLHTQQGYIRIDQYMRLCGRAYYAQKDPLGKNGDFVTAPEVSPLFGETIALRIAQHWRTHHVKTGTLFEAGAGRGTLMHDVVNVLQRLGFQRPQVLFYDCNRVLRQKQQQLIPWARYIDNATQLPHTQPLCILANEFFDALPVTTDAAHIVYKNDQWMLQMQPHTVVIRESNPDAEHLWQHWCAALQKAGRGSMAIIADYGYCVPPYRLTVRGFYKHQVCDLTHLPGQTDVTADVDFSKLQKISYQHGLYTYCDTQHRTLPLWGIRALWQHYASQNTALGERLQSGLDYLLNTMGERFYILESVVG